MKDTIKSLVASIKESDKRRTSAYDTAATVRRIEDGVAWVHIPGGVDETPVKLTINAAVGDTVQVRVSGGRAFLVGNASAPPTDDKVATKALTETRAVTKVVQTVQKIAETAAKIAGNTNQYFWHTETGTDTGAHITEIPQEEFLADPANGGGNLLARSNGIAVRDGLTELSYFSATEIRMGVADDYHVSLVPTGITFYADDGDPISEIKTMSNGIGQYFDNEDVYVLGGHGRQDRLGRHINELQMVASGDTSEGRVSAIGLHQISDAGSSDIDMYNGDISINGQNIYFGTGVTNPNIIFGGAIMANAVKSYTPTFESGQEPANYHCVVSAGICSLFYQGQGVAHSASTVLFTLPTGARPVSSVIVPFVKMTGGAVGVIGIATDGTVKVNQITNTSSTGRIYFNCSFPVV